MLNAERIWDLEAASLRWSLIRGRAFFKRSLRQWLFDNPRTTVLACHCGAVRFHDAVLELAGVFHTAPRPCNGRGGAALSRR